MVFQTSCLMVKSLSAIDAGSVSAIYWTLQLRVGDVCRLAQGDHRIRHVWQSVHQSRLLCSLRVRVGDLSDRGAQRRRRHGGHVWSCQQHGSILRRRTSGQFDCSSH